MPSTTSCPPCAIGVDANGLNQIAWFTKNIELTLDTVSVFVTIYNGTNRTASVTSMSTIYGDLATIDVANVEEAQSISSKYLKFAVVQYEGGGSVMLARQTDGAIQSITSIPWPTPFIKISSLDYAYSTVSTDNPYVTCQLSNPLPLQFGIEGVTSRTVGLPSEFYYPMNPTIFNFSMIAEGGSTMDYARFNMSDFESWLLVQPWAPSLIPSLHQCAFNRGLRGPPGVKIPVAALTSTASTTIFIAEPTVVTKAKPASTLADPLPVSTSAKPADTLTDSLPASTPVADPASKEVSQQDPKSTPYVESKAAGFSPSPEVAATTPHKPSHESEDPDNLSPDHLETKFAVTDHPGTPTTKAIVGGQTLSLPHSPTSNLVVAGTTLYVDGPAATISGQLVSLAHEGLVVDSSTLSFAAPASEATAIATVSGQTISRSPANGAIVVGGSTVSLNAPAVSVAGIRVSVNPSGLIVGSDTISLPPPGPSSVFTAAGQILTAVHSGIVISGQTLTPGAPAITVSGTAISLGTSDIVIGASTLPLPTQASTPTSRIFEIGGFTFSSAGNNGNGIVIGGTTLTLGAAAVTISGTSSSLGASGLVVGSSTYTLPTITPFATTVTLSGETYTIASNEVHVAGTVVPESQEVTVGGTEISLGASGLVVGDRTIALASSTARGLGEVIMSAFGPSGTPGTTSTGAGSNSSASLPAAFTGAADGRAEVGVWGWRWVIMGIVGGLVYIAWF